MMKNMVTRSIACVALGIALALNGCAPSNSGTVEMIGRKAPMVSLYTLEGDQVAFSSYRGKTVVLLFWAQWCSKSQRIVRELNEFAIEHNDGRFKVVGVNIDKPQHLANLRKLISEANLNSIEHYFSGNEIHDEMYVAFGVGDVPTIFVIGPDGTVKAQGHDIDVLEEYFKVD